MKRNEKSRITLTLEKKFALLTNNQQLKTLKITTTIKTPSQDFQFVVKLF